MQREPGWDETSWGESEEGCSSKPQFNTTFPSDQKVQVKYQTSNKQEMGKAAVAEYCFRPKGVAQLIGMFSFLLSKEILWTPASLYWCWAFPGLGTGVQLWGNHPGEITWKSSEALCAPGSSWLQRNLSLWWQKGTSSAGVCWSNGTTRALQIKYCSNFFFPSSLQLSFKMWNGKGWSLYLCLQKLDKKNSQTYTEYFTERTIQKPQRGGKRNYEG